MTYLNCSWARFALQEKWEFFLSHGTCSTSILPWKGPKILIFNILALFTRKCKHSTSSKRLQHPPSLVSIILKGYKYYVVEFEKLSDAFPERWHMEDAGPWSVKVAFFNISVLPSKPNCGFTTCVQSTASNSCWNHLVHSLFSLIIYSNSDSANGVI